MHWAHYLKNSLFSSRSPRFSIFKLGAPLFRAFEQSTRVCTYTTLLHFQQSARLLTKQKFGARDQNVLSFSHWAHYFVVIFSKVHEFVQNSVFRKRSPRFVIFPWLHHFLTLLSEVHEFVQNSKAAFSAREQHVLSFSHCAQHLLAIFSKVQKFVQNSIFSPRSARFIIFALGAPLFRVYTKVHEFVQNSVFRSRSACFVIFAPGAPLFAIFCKVHEFVQNSVFSPS